MKVVNYILIYILFLMLIASCIDPVTLKNEPAIGILVIEGGITTGLGPHIVRLTTSARYGDIFAGEVKGVKGAEVFIRDEIGNLIKLRESENGFYVTPNTFQGEVGKSYILLIETNDGEKYSSYSEKLLPVSPIDSIFYEFREIPYIGKEGLLKTKSGIDIKIKFKDPEGADNYYKWETNGFYKRETAPELFTITDSRTGNKIPAPKDCCATCWITEDNNRIDVSTDFLHDGNDVVHTSIYLEDDGVRFLGKYLITVNQFSISKEGYQFYDLIEKQLQISGDIFDPPPAEISGNMINLTNTSTPVIGYFRVSDVSSDSLYIYGEDFPFQKIEPIFKDDCRVLLKSTVVKPPFW